MIALSDPAFGIGFLVVLIVACAVYVAWFDRDVPAPTFTERSNVELVERRPFDWADDDELNDNLTPAHGRPRPCNDDWVRSRLSTG